MAVLPNKHLQSFGGEIHYPESDGNPMADNTKQLELIVYLFNNLKILFKDTERIFIAADHLWYPVEGDVKTRIAPDVMVCFDRPRGHRGSYKQWEEDDVAPQVVFEVLSPSNTKKEMEDKRRFYEKYGVEEFIIIDPDKETFKAFVRTNEQLLPVHVKGNKWQSPKLQMSLLRTSNGLKGLYPNDQPFSSAVELEEKAQERAQALQRAEWAKEEATKVIEEERKAKEEERRAKEEERRAKEEALAEIERLKAELKRMKEE